MNNPGPWTYEQWLTKPGSVEIRVSSALPFTAHDADGHEIGPQHWFPMYDYVWVSQELYDKIKQRTASR